MTLIISVIIFFLLSKTQTVKPLQIKTLKITTSFYPLAFLAETIGGQQVIVTNLTPPGAEPHDFEPSTRDIAQLEFQDIILLNGGGLEGYMDKIKENIDSKKTSLVIVGQPLMSDPQDPHVWLDPILYKKEAEMVTTAFIQKDPAHTPQYKANMERLAKEVDMLDIEFKQGLHSCKQKNIITSHKAFSYLAARYGLHQITLAGLSPEQEPSTKTLAEVATFAKTNKIRYIFFEELASPVIAETIAREVGAKILMLNPLEGLTQKDCVVGKTYVTIQKENLKNLQIALGCTSL